MSKIKLKLSAMLFHGSPRAVLFRSAVLIAAIGLLDWGVEEQIPLGFLYLLPMVMVGSVARRRTIVGAALLCTVLAELFSDLTWNLRTGASRDVLYFAAFIGAGLFIREVNKSRRTAAENLHTIERERDARQEAEEQLEILIASSPVGIFTTDADGHVLMANDAAHRMLAVRAAELLGTNLYKYLPALTNISIDGNSQHLLRAVMQARGQREDGEVFLADICFSTYHTNLGARMTVMVIDASEDLRTHEVSGLRQLLEGSRIAVTALSHEVRNVCGAIAAVHQSLMRTTTFAGNKDFEALGNLVIALEHIASFNLRQSASQASEVDLSVTLDELRIVISPSLRDDDITVRWVVGSGLPLVWADRSSLMLVLLNLITNSARALERKTDRMLSISARMEGDRVFVEVSDNGGGVAHPELLFRPFQAGAEQTGLGLYMSRAFLRSFQGELRYQSIAGGACFIVELITAATVSPSELWT